MKALVGLNLLQKLERQIHLFNKVVKHWPGNI